MNFNKTKILTRRLFKDMVSRCAGQPILIHSDMFFAGSFLSDPPKERDAFLAAHLSFLENSLTGSNLLFPAFNYDFPKTKIFDVESDLAQIGPLAEYVRAKRAKWRSHIPIFSFCSLNGEKPDPLQTSNQTNPLVIDPFDETSTFSEVARNDGYILFYGAALSSATFIHHVERFAGDPLYRYDKFFAGKILSAGEKETFVNLKYHVWPQSFPLNYNWRKIEDELLEAGLLFTVKDGNRTVARLLNAAQTREFWTTKIKTDPMYFLDAESRIRAEKKLAELGRRFILADFEVIQ